MDTTNEVRLNVTLGINDPYQKSVKVYPNPVTNIVTITSDRLVENATLYSITGRKLMTAKSNTQTLQLDISNLTPGIYIIKINDEHVVRITKQ